MMTVRRQKWTGKGRKFNEEGAQEQLMIMTTTCETIYRPSAGDNWTAVKDFRVRKEKHDIDRGRSEDAQHHFAASLPEGYGGGDGDRTQ